MPRSPYFFLGRRFPSFSGCLAVLFGLLALLAQGQTIQLFPRDYARQEKEDTVIGEGGRLTLVEDDNGDELEVATWQPSRADQRQKEIVLFTTTAEAKRKVETLPRPYTGWEKGQATTKQYAEPAIKDRTIYRVNSLAWHQRVSNSYEGAVLAESLAKLGWCWQEAQRDKLVENGQAPAWLVKQGASYEAAYQDFEAKQGKLQFLSLLALQLARLPALQAEQQAAVAEQAKLAPQIAAMQANLGEMEAGLAGRTPPPGDPVARRFAIMLMEDVDLQADNRWAEKTAERCQGEINRTLEALAAEFDEADKLPLADLQAAANQDLSALVAKVTPLVQARIKNLSDALAKSPDPQRHLAAVVQTTWELLQAASKTEANKAAALATKLKTAYPTQSAPEELAKAALTKFADKLPTIAYGRYQLTLRSRMEGIPNCLGTPIQVSFCGLTQNLYPYAWSDTERFHDIKVDFELREPPHILLDYIKPAPQAALFAYSRDLDAYNATRLKGWRFADEETLGRRLRLVFGSEGKDSPSGLNQALRRTEAQHQATLEISLKTLQTQRRAGRGLGAPDASLDAFSLESLTLKRVAEPALVLRQALVQRNWLRPGEPNAAQTVTGTLKATLINGLDDRQEMGERPVSLPAGSFARVVLPLTIPQTVPIWGQELRLTLVTPEGQQEASDVFTIHHNTFAVFSMGGHTGRQVYHDGKEYRNHNENFGVTIGDTVAVLPDDLRAPYVRGMTTGSIGHIQQTRAEAQRNHQLGVATVMYLSPLCTGDRAYYYYLRHPEWFPERLKWTEGMNDNWLWNQKAVAEAWYAGKSMDFFLKEYPILHLEQPVNLGNRLLFDRLVEDLITYHFMVDWDGTRWDGGPINVYPKDFLGRPLLDEQTGEPITTREALRSLAAARLHELKQRMWQQHPNWVYGNNGDFEGYGPTLLNLDKPPPDQAPYPHYREFMKDGGSYMDEGWMSADGFADSRNRVADYLKIAFKETQVMKQAGGYLQTFSPERDGAGHFEVDHLYYTLLPHLAGASYYGKMSASPWSQDGPVHFYTRFVGFLMDPALHALPEAERRIKLDAPGVWFHEAATMRKVSEQRVQIVIPLINQHPRERLYETHYRYNDLPRPLTGGLPMSVEIPPECTGLTPTVWDLNCEPVTTAKRLESTKAGTTVSFTVPGLKLFKLIVLDFQGGKP
jgi:hypothetical protein